METDIEVVQNSALGSKTTQIAVQKNYIGISPEEASKQMIDIFIENFPKLQQKAEEVARERAEHFCEKVLQKLEENKVTNFLPFSDPDVQYVCWQAQRDYARFGEEKMLNMLSSLVADRVENDSDDYQKIVIDRAISVAGFLSSQQLDYLSCLFMCKQVVFKQANSVQSLAEILSSMEQSFHPCSETAADVLNSLGCFSINIGSVTDCLAKAYSLDKKSVSLILPLKFKDLAADYACSQIGILLAIVNAENKWDYHFNKKVWIHK